MRSLKCTAKRPTGVGTDKDCNLRTLLCRGGFSGKIDSVSGFWTSLLGGIVSRLTAVGHCR